MGGVGGGREGRGGVVVVLLVLLLLLVAVLVVVVRVVGRSVHLVGVGRHHVTILREGGREGRREGGREEREGGKSKECISEHQGALKEKTR